MSLCNLRCVNKALVFTHSFLHGSCSEDIGTDQNRNNMESDEQTFLPAEDTNGKQRVKSMNMLWKRL